MPSDPEHLISAARHLDQGDFAQAAKYLATLADFRAFTNAALSLWDAVLAMEHRTRGSKTAPQPARTELWNDVQTFVRQPDPALAPFLFHKWKDLKRTEKDSLLALPICQVLMHDIGTLEGSERHFLMSDALALGQPQLVLAMWRAILEQDRGQVLEGWVASTLISAARAMGVQDPTALLSDQMREAGRTDLVPLLDVLSLAIRHGPPDQIRMAGLALQNHAHKRILLDYLARAPGTPNSFIALEPTIQDISAQMVPPFSGPNAEMVRLLGALSRSDWNTAEGISEALVLEPMTATDAIGLRAAAQIGTGKLDLARANANFLSTAPDLLWPDRSKGASLSWMARMAADKVQRLRLHDLPSATLGRPLAQSLWVGPRLRWIEQVALKSWVLNGWRVQLYVYDPPEDVPEGVELMDASTILPRKAVFRETASSGVHRGSLGAFSDWFRYELLLQRGGLWTDTDVINLHRFEPEDLRLISCEQSNIAFQTLNGAILAAPKGDWVIATLAAMSQKALQKGDLAFARIGPQLLCEVIAAQGTSGFKLLSTEVVNPLSWSETQRYFDPALDVVRDSRLSGAACLHVFTETWRLIGVDMNTLPAPDSFLGQVAARILAAPLPAPHGRADAVRHLIGLEG